MVCLTQLIQERQTEWRSLMEGVVCLCWVKFKRQTAIVVVLYHCDDVRIFVCQFFGENYVCVFSPQLFHS